MDDELWLEQNKRFVTLELKRLHVLLELRSLRSSEPEHAQIPALERRSSEIGAAQSSLLSEMFTPPALLRLAAVFTLSDFECEVLMLCAGIELDAALAHTVAELQERRREGGVTWSLALRLLSHPNWSATLRDGPLQRFGLLICADVTGGVVDRKLRLDERVLNFLLGIDGSDPRLEAIASPWRGPALLAHDQQALVPAIAAAIRGALADPPPCIVLNGKHLPTLHALAASAILHAGGTPWILHPERAMLGEASETWQHIFAREWLLRGLSLIVDAETLEGPNAAWTRSLIERHSGVVIAVGAAVTLPSVRSQFRVSVPSSTRSDQRSLWLRALQLADMQYPDAERFERASVLCAEQFVFEGTQVLDALRRGAGELELDGDCASSLWASALATCRQSFDDLAQRVEVKATLSSLTLEPHVADTLRAIVAHSKHGATVLGRWGFEVRYGRGLGISALFSGPSGTGKSSAAEVIAGELGLELYRIDLAGMVSKWIGETEKNLRKVFDAAESGGAVLLFDEADALFARRTAVANSHDRYANLEVSYLLQRIEAFQGVTILTTNLADNIDPAFMRRLRFAARFAFPDKAARAAIWRQVFPTAAPLHELDYSRLAQLRISGASIRAIALAAAFWAAERGQPVTMRALYAATRMEYRKLDQPVTKEELTGWPADSDPANVEGLLEPREREHRQAPRERG